MKHRNLVLIVLAFVLAFLFGAAQTAFAVSDDEEALEGSLAGALTLQSDDDDADDEDADEEDADDDEDADDEDDDEDADDEDDDEDADDEDDDDDADDDDDDDADDDDDDEDADDEDDDEDADDEEDDEDADDDDEDEIYDLEELDVVIYDTCEYDEEIDEYVYFMGTYTLTGDSVSPQPFVAIDEDGLASEGEENLMPLEEGVDYELSYENNTAIGKGTVIVTGIGDYYGEISETFRIGVPISKATVAKISPKVYTGKPIKPTPKVTFKGKTLKKGVDYTLSYKSNTNAGTGTITVKGIGANAGKKTVKFTIGKRSITRAKITKVRNQIYTGKQIRPSVKVTVNGKTLKKGKDYRVTYANNKKAGIAKITVYGKGNYTGKRGITFKISKAKAKAKAEA